MRLKIQNPKSKIQNLLIYPGLFLLALIPRAYDLQRFATADEAKWVYRSAQFLAALFKLDLPATSVNLTPAVTTTWLGSLGLTFYYQFNQAAINMPFTDWLLSLPEFRTEMSILVATRWPMIIFTSLGVVAIYLLAGQLFNRTLAGIGAILIALDPHTVALSRILGHDAPVAIFMTISLLFLLLAVKRANNKETKGTISTVVIAAIVWSGATAGLAFLSKAPAFFLIPFTGLVCLWQIWKDKTTFLFWSKQLLLWTAMAYILFVAVWPAAWVDPIGPLWTVIENAFLSATDLEEAGRETFWRVPNLGPFYYIVHGAFKLSPLVMIGLGLMLIPKLNRQKISPQNVESFLLLLVFALFFTIFMTLGDKRSPRYILPIFSPLALLAAYGWFTLYQNIRGLLTNHTSRLTHHASRITPLILFTLMAGILLSPYAPYYFTYFNPLLGGSYTAPHWVKVGWGEGLDQVGRFLQRELNNSRVGTAYTSTVAPFFQGDLSTITGNNLDYVVLYSKQVQSGQPSPAFIRYFEQSGSLFSVTLNGIPYANVYAGPALQPSAASTSNLDSSNPPKPMHFRSLTPYGRIGQQLDIDVVWPVDNSLLDTSVNVTLEPISALAIVAEDENLGKNSDVNPTENAVLAKGEGHLTRPVDELMISHHQLIVPNDLERGLYALFANGHPLGEIELRLFQRPAKIAPVEDTLFDNQIALIGYQFSPTPDYIGVNLAWQAQKSYLPNYTVFVQLLDAETNERVAGIDTQPVKGEWPTSRWVNGEVIVDKHLVAVPYGLPPGFYKVIVGLYQPQTGQRLILNTNQDHWAIPWTFRYK